MTEKKGKLTIEEFDHIEFITENKVPIDKLSAPHQQMIRIFADTYTEYEKIPEATEEEKSLAVQWTDDLKAKSRNILKVLEADYRYNEDGNFVEPKKATKKTKEEEKPEEEENTPPADTPKPGEEEENKPPPPADPPKPKDKKAAIPSLNKKERIEVIAKLYADNKTQVTEDELQQLGIKV